MPSQSDCRNGSIRRKCEGAHEWRSRIEWRLIEKCGELPISRNRCRSGSGTGAGLVCEIERNLSCGGARVGDREADIGAGANFRIDPSGLHRRHGWYGCFRHEYPILPRSKNSQTGRRTASRDGFHSCRADVRECTGSQTRPGGAASTIDGEWSLRLHSGRYRGHTVTRRSSRGGVDLLNDHQGAGIFVPKQQEDGAEILTVPIAPSATASAEERLNEAPHAAAGASEIVCTEKTFSTPEL